MIRSLNLLSLVLLGFAAGCPPVTGPPPTPTQPASRTADEPQQFAFIVRIKITSIQVPIGTASGSEEIWSYLDEERTRTVHTATLGRNGMRVGIAGLSTWPDLVKILTRMTGQKLGEQIFIAIPGQPFPVELKGALPAQTIFTSYSDRTLTGADYPPGDNLLTLNITLDENDRTRMIVTAVPQIRGTQRETGIVSEDDKLMFVERPKIYSFNPATFQFALSNKDIVVIGPGAESGRPTSIGNHWLLRDKHGIQMETVLVLSMDVVKAPLHETVQLK